MPPSDPAERLPTWVFVLVDAGLLGAAWYLAHQNPGPLSNTALLAISACVITGAAFVTVPLVLNYERKKNETLDERQRALEALAATVSSSAEQISIAAAGLHEIAALAQKNLQVAEFLPEKLRSQIAELGELIARTQDEEKAELQRELAALRTTESIRLEALSDKIAQSTAEWKSLETATRKHLAELRSNFAEIGSRPPVPAPTETARTSELTEKLTAALAAVEARLATLPTPAEASAPLPFDLQAALEAGLHAGRTGNASRGKTPSHGTAPVGGHGRASGSHDSLCAPGAGYSASNSLSNAEARPRDCRSSGRCHHFPDRIARRANDVEPGRAGGVR